MNSIVEAVKCASENTPQKLAIISGKNKVTYRELYEKISAFAMGLKSRQIKRGSRIVIEADDLISYFAAFLGCNLAGCIAVPIEKNIPIYTLQEILKNVKPKLVFMKNNGESYKEFFATKEKANFSLPRPKDISVIVSTTGTTGKPVLVTHTNKSNVATVENLINGTNMKGKDVAFTNLPFYLAVGFRRVFASLYIEATAIIHDSDISDKELADYINRYGVTHVALANSNLKILLDAKNDEIKQTLSKITCVESLAGPLTAINIRNFHNAYPNVILYNVYGTTESGCLLINNTRENSEEGCLGKTARHSDVFLIDENKKVITKPEVYGHIAVRGDTNMVGYYRKKALTEEVMPSDYIIISDIAYFDKYGYFYFVSRVGDVIDVKGHKIIPTEIENIAIKYEGITDCALVSVADERDINIPVLYVCPNENYNEEDLREYLSKELETYKIPKTILKITEIPRTSTGKIIRHSLRINKI